MPHITLQPRCIHAPFCLFFLAAAERGYRIFNTFARLLTAHKWLCWRQRFCTASETWCLPFAWMPSSCRFCHACSGLQYTCRTSVAFELALYMSTDILKRCDIEGHAPPHRERGSDFVGLVVQGNSGRCSGGLLPGAAQPSVLPSQHADKLHMERLAPQLGLVHGCWLCRRMACCQHPGML